MAPTRLAESGRFIIIDDLHLDCTVFEALVSWAKRHELTVQDAIQLAVCLLDERASDWLDGNDETRSRAERRGGPISSTNRR